MKYVIAIIAAILLFAATAQAAPIGWDFTGSAVRLLGNAANVVVQGFRFQATSPTATSSFPVASSTTFCLGTDCRTAWPTGGGTSTIYLASTTPWTTGNAAFVAGNGTLGSVATGTLTETVSGLELSATRGLFGGSAVLSLSSGFTIPTSSSLLTANSSTTGNLAFWSGNQSLGNVATGTLTEGVPGLEFTATRSLVGGAAVLNLTTGFTIPSTTLMASTSAFLTTPSSLCVAITGNAGLCDGVDDTAAGGSGLATTSVWTVGNLARVASTGAVNSIATSALALLISDTVGTLGETRGGTNQTTYTTGDLLYASSANTLTKRAIGSTGDVLSVVGGIPTWVATSTLGITGGSGADGVSNWLLSSGALRPTSTVGIAVAASSTIGDGTSAGGFTINGAATSTLSSGSAAATTTHITIFDPSNTNTWSTTTPWGCIDWRTGDTTSAGRKFNSICSVSDNANLTHSRLSFFNGIAGGNIQERMTIATDGNVGINNTIPEALLHILDNANAARGMIIQNNNTSANADPYINLKVGSTTQQYSVGIDNSDSDEFVITNGANPSSGTRLLTIKTGGLVGIGTDEPTAQLHVVGSGAPVSIVSGSNSIITTTDAGNTTKSVIARGSNTQEFGVYTGTTFNALISGTAQVSGVGATQLGFNTNNTAPIIFATDDWQERMRIQTGGNVGINTTTPSHRLTVNGDLRLFGRLVDSASSTGSLGMILQSTGTSTRWVATSTLGISGGGSGTVFLASSSPWTTGNLTFVTGNGTLGSRATTTLVAGTGITFSGGTPIIIGSSPITIESTGGGGGGGGSLSTTTDKVGYGPTSTVSYVTGDIMFGGSSSTTAEFQMDVDGAQFIVSTSSDTASTTILSTNSSEAVVLGEGDINSNGTWLTGEAISFDFRTVGQAIIRGVGAVTDIVFNVAVRLAAALKDATGSSGFSGQVLTSTGTSTAWQFPLQHRKFIEYFDDFTDETTNVGDGIWSEDINGASAACSATAIGTNFANRPGMSRCTTGSTATGRAALVTFFNSIALGQGTTTFETAVQITNLSVLAQRYVLQAGFFDTNSTSTADGAYILYDEGGNSTGSTASANWQCVTASNNSRTFSTSTVAVTESVVNRLTTVVNAAGTSVDFYVNDTLICTHTANIPTGTVRATSHGIQVLKATGGTARTFDIDYNYARVEFTTPR